MLKIPQILFMFAAVAFCAPYDNSDTKLKEVDNDNEMNSDPNMKNFANTITKMTPENLNFFYMQSLYAGALSMRAMQSENLSDTPTTIATIDDETTNIPQKQEATTEKTHKSDKEEEVTPQYNFFLSPHIDVQNSPKIENYGQQSYQFEYPKSNKQEFETTFGAMFNSEVNKETIYRPESEEDNAVINIGHDMMGDSQSKTKIKQSLSTSQETIPQTIYKQTEHSTEDSFIFGSMKLKTDDQITPQEQSTIIPFASNHPNEPESRIVSTKKPVSTTTYLADEAESNNRKTIDDEIVTQEQTTVESPGSDEAESNIRTTIDDKINAQEQTTVESPASGNLHEAESTNKPIKQSSPYTEEAESRIRKTIVNSQGMVSDATTLPSVTKTLDSVEPNLAPVTEYKLTNEQEENMIKEIKERVMKEITEAFLTNETTIAESAKDVLTILEPEDIKAPHTTTAETKTVSVFKSEANPAAKLNTAVNLFSTTEGRNIDETTILPEDKNGLADVKVLHMLHKPGTETSNTAAATELVTFEQTETEKSLAARELGGNDSLKVFDKDIESAINKPIVDIVEEEQKDRPAVQNLNEAIDYTNAANNWIENMLRPEIKRYLSDTPEADTVDRTETKTVNVIQMPLNHFRATTKKATITEEPNMPQTTTNNFADVITTTNLTPPLSELTTVVDGNVNEMYDLTTVTNLNEKTTTEEGTTVLVTTDETTIDGIIAKSDVTTDRPANIGEIIQAMAKYVMTNGTVDMLNNSESRNMHISKKITHSEVTTPTTTIMDSTTVAEEPEVTSHLPEQSTEVIVVEKSELENIGSEIEMISATTMDTIISSSTITADTPKQANNLNIVLLPPQFSTETHTSTTAKTNDSIAYATTMKDVVVPTAIMNLSLPKKATTTDLELQILKPTPESESTLPTESYRTSTNAAATDVNSLGSIFIPDATSMLAMLTDDDRTEQTRISETTNLSGMDEMETTVVTDKMFETAPTEISEALDFTRDWQQSDNNNDTVSTKGVLTETQTTTQSIPLRKKPPVKISRILSDEGVEVYYGYSNVERN